MKDIDYLRAIKMKYMAGIISYDQAKSEADQYIKNMNISGQKIAKKHGKRFPGISFASIMR